MHALDALLAQTTTTGYVVLDSMAIVMLEVAYSEATTPAIDPATLPRVEDYTWWKQCRMVDGIHARTGR